MDFAYTLLIVLFVILIISFNIFIILLDKKIKELEKIIIDLFDKRSDLIPSLYEITKKYLTKHDEVFSEILKLRKLKFLNSKNDFTQIIQNELNIHHELNFIFKLSNKHPKIQKNEKFLLIRDLFLENASNIWDKISLYKKITKKFNNFLILKNFTIIWLFINLEKKENI